MNKIQLFQQTNNKHLYEFTLKSGEIFVGIIDQPIGVEELYFLIKPSDIRTLNEAKQAKNEEKLREIRRPVLLDEIVSLQVAPHPVLG